MIVSIMLILSVQINEIMSNPLGGSGAGKAEDRNEFIEIYNEKSCTVDLSGWIITDFDSEDSLLSFYSLSPDSSCRLAPEKYALIFDPEYKDSGENYMPYGIPDCILLRPENTTIGNGLTTNDSIALINKNGDTVSTFFYPFNPGDGISVERVSPLQSDNPENWKACIDSCGFTAGKDNSVYYPPDFKLSEMTVEDTTVILFITNNADTVLEGYIDLFLDKNHNREMENQEIIKTEYISGLPEDSTITINFNQNKPAVYTLGLNLLKQKIFRRFRIKDGISNLILNEIMFAPDDMSEWLELHNRSSFSLNVESLWVNDKLINQKIKIPPQSFIIITSDSSRFFSYYGNTSTPIFGADITLSNELDSIKIKDSHNFIIDRYRYNGKQCPKGYSLEKVCPDLTSYAVNNWDQSIYRGGSPGVHNSIFNNQVGLQDMDISISPRHFTPDNDGKDERCIITFTLPYIRNEISLAIFDRRGHLLRKSSHCSGGSRDTWIWDGRDNSGKLLKSGLYILSITIKDMSSNKFISKRDVVSLGTR